MVILNSNKANLGDLEAALVNKPSIFLVNKSKAKKTNLVKRGK